MNEANDIDLQSSDLNTRTPILLKIIYSTLMVFFITFFSLSLYITVTEFSEKHLKEMLVMGIITLILLIIYLLFIKDKNHSNYDESKTIIFLKNIYLMIMLIFMGGFSFMLWYKETLFITAISGLGVASLVLVSIYVIFIRSENYSSKTIIFLKKVYLMLMSLFILMFSVDCFEIIFLDNKTLDSIFKPGIAVLFLLIIYMVSIKSGKSSRSYGSKIIFLNPNTKILKEAPLGFSWTTFFFAFFVPLFRRDWKWGIMMFIAFFISSGLSNFLFMFLYNRLYIKDLIASGFRVNSLTKTDRDLLSADLNMPIPILEKEEAKESIENAKIASETNNYIELKECPNCNALKVIKVKSKYMCIYCKSIRYI